jgi:hypothetical protein
LKREGRFIVLWSRVLTSGRRFRKTSPLQLLAGAIRMIFSPVKMITERSSVEKIWYDSNRADDDKVPGSLIVRLSNGVALLVLVILLTGPVWNFIPWSMTPLASLAGKMRFGIATIISHFGFIFWPAGLVLLVNLCRQKPGVEWIKLMALTAFCFWQAWACTANAIRIWSLLGHWMKSFHEG